MDKKFNEFDNGSTTLKVALLKNTYTPDQDAHTTWNDVSAYETSGTGYTTGGATLASVAVTYASKVTTFDAADSSWAGSTVTARYAVVYDDTTAGATNKKLIMYVDFGADHSSSSSTFGITWAATGLATFTVS